MDIEQIKQDLQNFKPTSTESLDWYENFLRIIYNTSCYLNSNIDLNNINLIELEKICKCFNVRSCSLPIFQKMYIDNNNICTKTIQVQTVKMDYSTFHSFVQKSTKNIFYIYTIIEPYFRYAAVDIKYSLNYLESLRRVKRGERFEKLKKIYEL